MNPESRVVLLTGAQAAGKSTVGRALARLADRGVFLDGDTFWQAVVSGRVDMDGQHNTEALAQLHLRYRAMAEAAKVYARAGFLTVLADNVYGDALAVVREALAPVPLVAVALTPSPESVAAREVARGTSAYAGWAEPGLDLLDVARTFDSWVRATPVDHQHDSSDESPDETAAALYDWLARRS